MIKGKYKKWIFSTLLTAAAIALLDALVLEKYFFKIKHIPIGNSGSSQSSLRLLFMTDLHLKKHLTAKHHRLSKAIKELKPDIMLVSGDLLDEHGELKVLEEFLQLLDYSLPKVAIPGNHDYKASARIKEIASVLASFNGKLLVNESKVYILKGQQLVVTGLDDFIRGESHLEKATENIGKEKNHIALIHSPLQQETLKASITEINRFRKEEDRLTIRYLFVGHNHGGQVSFFGLFAPFLPIKSGDYLQGWYNQEQPYLYLSKGFGTSTIPLRFFARAEVVLFHYYL